MWRSSLQSHFFGLISTFCMDLFSSIARGTKATGKEFGPCEKVQISPKIRKSLYGVGIGIEIFLPWEQWGKKCEMWRSSLHSHIRQYNHLYIGSKSKEVSPDASSECKHYFPTEDSEWGKHCAGGHLYSIFRPITSNIHGYIRSYAIKILNIQSYGYEYQI